MRILCLAPPDDPETPELATALLQEGHPVLTLAPPTGTWNLLALRALRNACTEFNPDLIFERHIPGNHAGAWLARRTARPRFLATETQPEDPASLLLVPTDQLRQTLTAPRIETLRGATAPDRFLPAPFRPNPTNPSTVFVFGDTRQDPARLPDLLAGAAIAVFPRIPQAASPPALFACMAAGTAIVAPDQPNIREILAHEQTALLFESTPDQAVTRLLANADLVTRLGTAARAELDRQDHSWRANARRIVAWASPPLHGD